VNACDVRQPKDVPTSSQDRVRGCILGSVIGDAFGTPLEGASQAAMAPLVDRRSKNRGAWGYSDDGAMVLACAEALASVGTIEPTALLRAFVRHYEPARGFGRGMKLAITAFDGGVPWDRCAFAAWPEGSRGNGGAVRIPPVAVARWPTSDAFDLAVRLATRVTHAHDDALAFARLHAVTIAVVLDDPAAAEAPAALRSAILDRLAPVPAIVTEKLEIIFELIAADVSHGEAARRLGTSTLASESVPAALWSFAAHHRSFSEAVASAALLGGDVDSICCLVGALAGTLHGAEGIDRQWIDNLSREQPSPPVILALADALHDLVPTAPGAAA
jgi:poly(ADP-ribose) glycohydrolase ARH3